MTVNSFMNDRNSGGQKSVDPLKSAGRKKNCQPRILSLEKYPSRSEGEIKTVLYK